MSIEHEIKIENMFQKHLKIAQSKLNEMIDLNDYLSSFSKINETISNEQNYLLKLFYQYNMLALSSKVNEDLDLNVLLKKFPNNEDRLEFVFEIASRLEIPYKKISLNKWNLRYISIMAKRKSEFQENLLLDTIYGILKLHVYFDI